VEVGEIARTVDGRRGIHQIPLPQSVFAWFPILREPFPKTGRKFPKMGAEFPYAGKGHAGGRAWQVRSVNEEQSGFGQQEMNFKG